VATGRLLRTGSLAILIALTGIMAVALVRNVVRDRKALEQIRSEGEAWNVQVPAPSKSPPLGAISGTTAPSESVHTSEEVFRKASPSVVTVKIFRGEDKRLLKQGSGVVVAPGTVATNRHVVEAGSEIRVIDHGQSYWASVTYADGEYDLCALDVPGLSAPPVDMATVQTLRVGQRVYAIGAPRGLELSISDGLVSAVRPYGAFPLIQTNAPISKGSSGGGLFDTDGRLVGITTFSAMEGQNINFALAADLVSHLPERTADIRTLKPVVPVRRADEIAHKELLDALQEGKQAIADAETELKRMGEEILRHTAALNEMQHAMNGFLSSGDTKAYNELVPRYNERASQRNELTKRYEGNRQAYGAMVERQNRLAERYNNLGRMQ
jgi:hypothetical protein